MPSVACASATVSPGPGPRTRVAYNPVSDTAPAVHTAPSTVHPPGAGTSITDTAPSPAGSTVTSNRSFAPSTRLTPVTVPPVADSAWSRRSSGEISTSSLNDSRSVKALDPSWLTGSSRNAAVSASAACCPAAPRGV